MEIRTDYSDVHFKENGKLKLLIIVGTRPEIIRLAAVINKCRKYFDVILAHTGQNYDYNLNGIFFENLKIASPEVYMDAVGDDLGATVGNIINCSYKLMNQIRPDALLILGDTNSCLSAIAAKRLLPCIVKENLSDQDAWIYVIETNVLQRSFSEMLPSEKAAVLALRYSKMICQGRRNDIIEELKKLENPDEIRENKTCGIDCHKSKSRDVVGAEYNLKGRAVANYLRINELSVALKIRIDDGEFTIAAAVQLSYLAQEEQQMVEAVLSESEYKVNEGKAVLLREYTGKLTPERAEQILSGEFSRKPKKSTAAAFKVKPAIYKKYFTASITQKEFDSIVDEALALYFAQKEAAAV